MVPELFEIQYAKQAVADVHALRPFDQKKVLDAIEIHLLNEPMKTSRSRIKRMAQPFWSEYRLRVDDIRVYYDVDEPKRTVSILRILEKGSEPTSRG
ncbi:MAG: type II toxin-antitoxin system RelE/ParE family toxin [Gemmataceae bacterium]|nr:type II toxin-antitoxin system RelE/ParE family toxin [Gemmataceae bacterium]